MLPMVYPKRIEKALSVGEILAIGVVLTNQQSWQAAGKRAGMLLVLLLAVVALAFTLAPRIALADETAGSESTVDPFEFLPLEISASTDGLPDNQVQITVTGTNAASMELADHSVSFKVPDGWTLVSGSVSSTPATTQDGESVSTTAVLAKGSGGSGAQGQADEGSDGSDGSAGKTPKTGDPFTVIALIVAIALAAVLLFAARKRSRAALSVLLSALLVFSMLPTGGLQAMADEVNGAKVTSGGASDDESDNAPLTFSKTADVDVRGEALSIEASVTCRAGSMEGASGIVNLEMNTPIHYGASSVNVTVLSEVAYAGCSEDTGMKSAFDTSKITLSGSLEGATVRGGAYTMKVKGQNEDDSELKNRTHYELHFIIDNIPEGAASKDSECGYIELGNQPFADENQGYGIACVSYSDPAGSIAQVPSDVSSTSPMEGDVNTHTFSNGYYWDGNNRFRIPVDLDGADIGLPVPATSEFAKYAHGDRFTIDGIEYCMFTSEDIVKSMSVKSNNGFKVVGCDGDLGYTWVTIEVEDATGFDAYQKLTEALTDSGLFIGGEIISTYQNTTVYPQGKEADSTGSTGDLFAYAETSSIAFAWAVQVDRGESDTTVTYLAGARSSQEAEDEVEVGDVDLTDDTTFTAFRTTTNKEGESSEAAASDIKASVQSADEDLLKIEVSVPNSQFDSDAELRGMDKSDTDAFFDAMYMFLSGVKLRMTNGSINAFGVPEKDADIVLFDGESFNRAEKEDETTGQGDTGASALANADTNAGSDADADNGTVAGTESDAKDSASTESEAIAGADGGFSAISGADTEAGTAAAGDADTADAGATTPAADGSDAKAAAGADAATGNGTESASATGNAASSSTEGAETSEAASTDGSGAVALTAGIEAVGVADNEAGNDAGVAAASVVAPTILDMNECICRFGSFDAAVPEVSKYTADDVNKMDTIYRKSSSNSKSDAKIKSVLSDAVTTGLGINHAVNLIRVLGSGFLNYATSGLTIVGLIGAFAMDFLPQETQQYTVDDVMNKLNAMDAKLDTVETTVKTINVKLDEQETKIEWNQKSDTYTNLMSLLCSQTTTDIFTGMDNVLGKYNELDANGKTTTKKCSRSTSISQMPEDAVKDLKTYLSRIDGNAKNKGFDNGLGSAYNALHNVLVTGSSDSETILDVYYKYVNAKYNWDVETKASKRAFLASFMIMYNNAYALRSAQLGVELYEAEKAKETSKVEAIQVEIKELHRYADEISQVLYGTVDWDKLRKDYPGKSGQSSVAPSITATDIDVEKLLKDNPGKTFDQVVQEKYLTPSPYMTAATDTEVKSVELLATDSSRSRSFDVDSYALSAAYDASCFANAYVSGRFTDLSNSWQPSCSFELDELRTMAARLNALPESMRLTITDSDGTSRPVENIAEEMEAVGFKSQQPNTQYKKQLLKLDTATMKAREEKILGSTKDSLWAQNGSTTDVWATVKANDKNPTDEVDRYTDEARNWNYFFAEYEYDIIYKNGKKIRQQYNRNLSSGGDRLISSVDIGNKITDPQNYIVLSVDDYKGNGVSKWGGNGCMKDVPTQTGMRYGTVFNIKTGEKVENQLLYAIEIQLPTALDIIRLGSRDFAGLVRCEYYPFGELSVTVKGRTSLMPDYKSWYQTNWYSKAINDSNYNGSQNQCIDIRRYNQPTD